MEELSPRDAREEIFLYGFFAGILFTLTLIFLVGISL